jgi:GR25 family glycosyltransferase involved in LPS biosynthesis
MVELRILCLQIVLVILLYGANAYASMDTMAVDSVGKILKDTGTHVFVLMGTLKDRYDNMREFTKSLGLSAEEIAEHVTTIRAVTKDDLKSEKLRDNISSLTNGLIDTAYFDRGVKNSAGVLGCLITHIMAWKALMDSNYTNALIFEDDVAIAKSDELRQRGGYNTSHTYPTARSRSFEPLTDAQKQLVLFHKMMKLHPSLWDIQYHGYCYECGHTVHLPIRYAKYYYFNNGIDPFLPIEADEGLFDDLDKGHISNNFDANHVVTEAEADEFSKYFFYYRAFMPLCAHSYLLNRKFGQALFDIVVPGGLNYDKEEHWSSDGYLMSTACKTGLKKIRPMVPIFAQVSVRKIGGIIGHSYDKVPETRDTCANKARHCHSMYVEHSKGTTRTAE